jgi:hypothetical protein
MKTFFLKITAFAFTALLILSALSTSSCKKDKTCRGKVRVFDTAGALVGNAKVKLHATAVAGDVVYESFTDGTGYASFEVKLPAIFDVVATKTTFPSMSGNGVLRLDEPGTEAEVTVTIR